MSRCVRQMLSGVSGCDVGGGMPRSSNIWESKQHLQDALSKRREQVMNPYLPLLALCCLLLSLLVVCCLALPSLAFVALCCLALSLFVVTCLMLSCVVFCCLALPLLPLLPHI